MDDPAHLLARLRHRWTPARSLVPALEADALLAWIDAAADRGDGDAVRAATPRLLELAVADDLGPRPVWEALAHLDRAGWRNWPQEDQWAVEAVLDAWWLATLLGHPSRPPAAEVLAAQARLRGEVRPLLDRWVDELDGAGAVHLAEFVVDEIDPATGLVGGPPWSDVPDLGHQVVAWARSEAVILGLALVGGVHLEPGVLSEALDRMV